MNTKKIKYPLFALILASISANAQTVTESPNSIARTDSLENNYQDLEELVVVQKKEIVKSDGATLTYDLDQDDTTKGSTVLEALKKVPMVSVDGEDNIRIKGDSNFKIYVNGKEEPMMTANAKYILKAMPAESVSKIEVITEPGAKYDAEGTGGIINLITERKQRKDSYAGTLNASIGAQQEELGAYGRIKYDRITADANIHYADNSLMKKANRMSMETINQDSEQAYRTIQSGRQKFGFQYLGGGLNMSWEPTDKDLISISGNLISLRGDLDELFCATETRSRDGILMSAFNQDATGEMTHFALNSSISYQRTFSEPGHNFIAAYAFNYGKRRMCLDYLNENVLDASYLPDAERNDSKNFTREHTATLDYTNPIGDGKHKIETGVKGVFRRNSANSGQLTGEDFNSLVPVSDNMALTHQLQDIYAAYFSYSGSFGKLAAKAGLRYEHTYMGMDFIVGQGTNYRRNLNDIAPNAALTWIFGPATNLRLAYQMRITRPTIEQMNPFRFQILQNTIRTGNPDLSSERYHNLNLTYSNFGRKFGGNIGIEVSQSNNTIEDYIFYDNNIRYETYANMGHRQRASLNGFFNWNITNSMSLGLNGSLYYTYIRSGNGEIKNHGWNGSYGANFNYTGPLRIKYSAYGGQSTGDISLQGKWYGWYYYGIGISRSFLKNDALTVALNASNFLTKYSHYKSMSYTSTHSERTKGANPSWNVGISISWNFGHLSDQVKKTGADLENTDTKSTGKGQGSGGLGL